MRGLVRLLTPAFSSVFHIKRMDSGVVKKALVRDPSIPFISSGVVMVSSSTRRRPHGLSSRRWSRLAGNAWPKALSPKPEYLVSILCSLGVACRPAASMVWTSLIAAILASHLVTAPAAWPMSEDSLRIISVGGMIARPLATNPCFDLGLTPSVSSGLTALSAGLPPSRSRSPESRT